MDDWSLTKRILTFRVNMGSSYIVIPDCEVSYYMDYNGSMGFYLKDPYGIDIRELKLPAWGNFLKERILDFLKNNPSKLENSYNKKVIEVD